MSQTQHNTPTTQRTASRAPVKQRQTIDVPTWQAHEPHSQKWFTQALRRYPKEQERTKRIQKLSASDPYLCFQCENLYGLADVCIRNDKTQTFRYCQECIQGIEQGGTAIHIMRTIADPEQEESSFDEPVFDEPVGNKTIELPETHVATVERQGKHPLFWIGSTMTAIIIFLFVINQVVPVIQDRIAASYYQTPPISQLDIQMSGKEYHLIAQNLKGNIIVIAEPYGDIGHSHVYTAAEVSSGALIPTMTFNGVSIVYVHVESAIFEVKLS